jgi:hypothetical protein
MKSDPKKIIQTLRTCVEGLAWQCMVEKIAAEDKLQTNVHCPQTSSGGDEEEGQY